MLFGATIIQAQSTMHTVSPAAVEGITMAMAYQCPGDEYLVLDELTAVDGVYEAGSFNTGCADVTSRLVSKTGSDLFECVEGETTTGVTAWECPSKEKIPVVTKPWIVGERIRMQMASVTEGLTMVSYCGGKPVAKLKGNLETIGDRKLLKTQSVGIKCDEPSFAPAREYNGKLHPCVASDSGYTCPGTGEVIDQTLLKDLTADSKVAEALGIKENLNSRMPKEDIVQNELSNS